MQLAALRRLQARCTSLEPDAVRFQAKAVALFSVAVYVLFFAFLEDPAEREQQEMQIREDAGSPTDAGSRVESFLQAETTEANRRRQRVTFTREQYETFFAGLAPLEQRFKTDYAEGSRSIGTRHAHFDALMRYLTDKAPELLPQHDRLVLAWKEAEEFVRSNELFFADQTRVHLDAIGRAKERLHDRKLTIGDYEDVEAARAWLENSLKLLNRASHLQDAVLAEVRRVRHPLVLRALEPLYIGQQPEPGVLDYVPHSGPMSLPATELGDRPMFVELFTNPPREVCVAMINSHDEEIRPGESLWRLELRRRAANLSALLYGSADTGRWTDDDQRQFEELVPATLAESHGDELYAAFEADQRRRGNPFPVERSRLDRRFVVHLPDGRRVGAATRSKAPNDQVEEVSPWGY